MSPLDHETIEQLTQAILPRIFVPLEASARHVHLTREQCLTLFGCDLTPVRPLSQPGQYLSQQRLTIVGPKGQLENVAVLGPARQEAQVEISLTDSRTLGLQPPIRLSGHVEDTPGVLLRGPMGQIDLPGGVIVAQRHIHLPPEDAARFGVSDKQVVNLETFTCRPTVFRDVVVRVSHRFCPAAHLDFDEANACGLRTGDWGRILP